MRSWISFWLQSFQQALPLYSLILYYSCALFCLDLDWATNRSWKLILGAILIACLIITLLHTIKSSGFFLFKNSPPVLWNRSILFPIIFLFALIGTIDAWLWIYLDQRISPGTCFVFFETNWAESREFLHLNVDFRLFWLVLYHLMAIFFAFICKKISLKSFWYSLILLPASAGILFVYLSSYPALYNPGLAFFKSLLDYKKEVQAYRELRDPLADRQIQQIDNPDSPHTLVLVIGESSSRHHMQLYGYPRQTNPWLSSLETELYVFSDVISPHSHTEAALKKVLSLHHQESTDSWYQHPTLMEILHAAGYHTYWLSNQEAMGLWANGVTALASQADVQIFTEMRSSDLEGEKSDLALLPLLDRSLKDSIYPKKCIVLHLMGTHGAYKNRYPEEFDHFQSNSLPNPNRPFLNPARIQTINEYDNAIRFNDYVLHQVIERLKEETEPSAMIYFSDHGEEVYESRNFVGHTEALGSRFMVEIPFLIWLNTDWLVWDETLTIQLEQARDLPFMTDDLPQLIMDMLHMQSSLLDSSKSPLQSAFNVNRERRFRNITYDSLTQKPLPRHLLQEQRNKIWLHRTNSIQKLQKAVGLYAGVELDLVIAQKDGEMVLDIYHPPKKSKGLILADYWNALDQAAGMSYWLDFKNLQANNYLPALHRLNQLVQRFQLSPSQIIVESPHCQYLASFTDAGYQTAYYLPYLDLEGKSDSAQQKIADELLLIANGCAIKSISYPGYMQAFMDTYMQEHLKNLSQLSWYPTLSDQRPEDAVFLQKLIQRPEIDVILVANEH